MLEYNICYSLDSKYTEQLAVSMVSILKNADVKENINFYILDGGLTKQDKLNIEQLKNIKDFSIHYIDINPADFESCPMLKDRNEEYSSYHVTLPTYFRFKLPSLLNNIDKILYLDCDVLIRTSLKELFSVNLKKYAAAMVLDAESIKESKRLGTKNYFNAGVMLINLDYWRENNIEEKLFAYAEKNSETILWQDQDVINAVLKDEIKQINEKWNFQYFLYENIDVNELAKCSVFHLAGRFKPWLIPFEHPVYDYYYYYLAYTPWKNKIIQYKQMASCKYLKDNIGGSRTNILLTATDEDIRKVYQEINKNYEYTEETRNLLNSRMDVAANEIKDFVFNEIGSDISKIYDEISKNYDYTNELSDSANDKINRIKDEVVGLVNSSKTEVIVQTDEKISGVYDEISKNYNYINSLNENTKDLISQTKSEIENFVNKSVETLSESQSGNISGVYNEITKNYEYTNDIRDNLTKQVENLASEFEGGIENSRISIISQTDEKISKVYEEISKNYDYTNELSTAANDNIVHNREEIINFINSSKEEITVQTDEKISQVYGEISRNYNYTNDLNNSAKDAIDSLKTELCNTVIELDNTKSVIDNTKLDLDNTKSALENTNLALDNTKLEQDKIKEELSNINSALCNSITEQKNQTDILAQRLESSNSEIKSEIDVINNELNSRISYETAQTDSKISLVYDEITKNYKYTEKLVSELDSKSRDNLDIVNNNLNDLKSRLGENIENINNLRNYTDNKINDVYSYANENTADIYKTLNNNHQLLDNKIEQKNYEQYQKNEEFSSLINQILNNKIDKEEVNLLSSKIQERINYIEEQYNISLNNIQNLFSDELNNQRIKYEKKLIEMENIIKSLDEKYQPKKKSLFSIIIKKERNK